MLSFPGLTHLTAIQTSWNIFCPVSITLCYKHSCLAKQALTHLRDDINFKKICYKCYEIVWVTLGLKSVNDVMWAGAYSYSNHFYEVYVQQVNYLFINLFFCANHCTQLQLILSYCV